MPKRSFALKIVQGYDWLGRVVEQDRYDYSSIWNLFASSTSEYNAEGSVTDLDEANTTATIADYSLSYDVDQELTQSIDHGNTTNFAYDALGELTTYGDAGSGTTTQAFDAGGNADTSASDGTTLGNEMTTYVDPVTGDTMHYAYDHAGNETHSIDSPTGVT